VNDTPPEISIVIPVYNEEAILFAAVAELHERLRDLGAPYEILLCENGSRDRTIDIARDLERRFPEVRHLSIGEPNYGRALRMGMFEARGTFVMCDEIDLGDVDFHARALAILRKGEADLVVGSKAISGAQDERPWLRHLATLVLNLMLRVALGFRGTDTHGLKAFRREALLATAKRCLVEKDLFASEFVIRAQREGIRHLEIPVRVIEKRRPSVNLLRRVPNVLKNLARLFVAIRLRKG
jgi:glycosyltransferase involved in cell wall biosynthesis